MNRFVKFFFLGLLLLQVLIAQVAHAACAKVSIELLQQLTVERVAFDAKLVITNGITDQSLDNIRVDVNITDSSGNVKSDIFFVRPPALTNISGALDGTGIVVAGSKGESHWLIIPSPGAGGESTTGTDYWVGATLSYTVNGNPEVVPINPAKITVKPMPQLVLDYFVPYQVIGDNPFTPQVESPVPYPLAVRVLNDGYGMATNLRIDSAQPKIVDNKQGLLINFRILGAAVNDSAVTPLLTVNFGDLASKKAATASWQMISTLMGRFESFSASFSHASELGGDLTSFIKKDAVKTHYLTHMVKVSLPGRDGRLDFLAEAIPGTTSTALPDTIFETEISYDAAGIASDRLPVTRLQSSQPERPTPQKPGVALSLPTVATGWIYTKLADPSQGLLRLLDVIRADGVHLDSHNFWVDQGVDPITYKKTWTLQFIDYRAPNTTTSGDYTILFAKPDVDTTPPTTTLIFDGPTIGANPAYITPQTRLLLTATDNDGGSGVDGMFKKVAGQDTDFVPALPFNLTTAGNYTVQFYSSDLAGNVENPVQSASVTVVAAAPVVSSFTATPTNFAPQAPKGIAAARTLDFSLSATSGVATLPVEIKISSGASFQADKIVRTLKGTATPGSALALRWDGKDSSGKLLPIGSYTAQAKVSDGLDNAADANAPVHSTTASMTVAIADWFNASAVDPNPAADQLHPKVSGTKIVWQDMRSGHGEIFLKDLAGGNALKIGSGIADHQYPAIDGNVVVWQDNRSGNWDIYGYDLASNTEFPISTAAGDQTQPVIAGNWVAWQDNRNGNLDVYAYNITTHETVPITSHERDQLHPAISGTTVSWEDYRHGLGEIYQYDLIARSERQASSGPADETLPAVSGATLVWTDRRNGQSDIFNADPVRGALRITYGTGDHSQAAVLSDLLVFTDYENGANDPNLSFRILSSGIGDRLTADPARQEEPAIGTGYVLWQDNRLVGETNPDRHFQIYVAPFTTEATVIEAQLKPGFNLVAVGSSLATQSALALIAAKGGELGTMRLLSHDPLHNTYTETTATTGTDFTPAKGVGLVIYAEKAGTLKLAESGETATYTLLPGTNQIGILTVPFGYSAYALAGSVGLDNIQSVRRFDTTTGSWQTVSLRPSAAGNELVGQDFAIQPGDGLVLTMKIRVDGWAP
jgi:beta propeller repeat protein